MIEPYDVFRYYMALKLHFGSGEYDCIKYNFKTSVTQNSFFRRRDRYHFAKAGRKFDNTSELIGFLVSQFIDDREWIGDMLGNDAERAYSQWKKRHESLSYLFGNDLSELISKAEEFDSLFQIDTSKSPYPLLVSEYLSGSVMLESIVILNKMTGFMDDADRQVSEPIMWDKVSRKIHKYSPFVKFDKAKIRDKILSVYSG